MASSPSRGGVADPRAVAAASSSAWPAGIRPKLLLMVAACIVIELCFVDVSMVSWGNGGVAVADTDTRLLVSKPAYADALAHSRTFSSFTRIEDEDTYLMRRLEAKNTDGPAEAETSPPEVQDGQEESTSSTDDESDDEADLEEDGEEEVEEEEASETFLAGLPDLVPTLVLPGRIDVDAYVSEQAGRVQPEAETLSRREVRRRQQLRRKPDAMR